MCNRSLPFPGHTAAPGPRPTTSPRPQSVSLVPLPFPFLYLRPYQRPFSTSNIQPMFTIPSGDRLLLVPLCLHKMYVYLITCNFPLCTNRPLLPSADSPRLCREVSVAQQLLYMHIYILLIALFGFVSSFDLASPTASSLPSLFNVFIAFIY